jgi:hypothetical protein
MLDHVTELIGFYSFMRRLLSLQFVARCLIQFSFGALSAWQLSACSTNDSNDTGVNRSSDDDDIIEKDEDDADDDFTYGEYLATLCDVYTRCSPTLRARYGDKEQCTAYHIGITNVTARAPLDLGPIWDVDCLRDLASLECPETSPSRDAIEVGHQLQLVAAECVALAGLPCNDDDDCLSWRCSSQGDGCGVCEPPDGQSCRSTYECALGETCYAGECTAPKPVGAACETSDQCQTSRCNNSVCVEPVALGGSCVTTLDCASSAWCKASVCVNPALPGEACTTEEPLSCQLGNACYEGVCQAVEYNDVPVGGRCAWTDSCIPSARCTDSICTQTADSCNSDAHCAEDEYCDHECLPARDDGAPCVFGSECKSSSCSEAKICEDLNPCD